MAARTMAMSAGEVQVGARVFPGIVGFFFVFRAGLTFLFFQADPVAGTAVSLGFGLALMYGAIVYSTEDAARLPVSLERARPVRWIFAMLGLSLASLLWTGAASRGVALAYWVGMAADVAIVLLLVRRADPQPTIEAMMQGAIWGAAVLAAVAWCSPVTDDLRLGNDAFLHPNALGLEIGPAALMAQYFAPRARRWKWLSIALAITLLRTLSKTAILAFVIAEGWVLLQHKAMTRRTKIWIVALTLLVVASFWGVLTAYLDIYNSAGAGNQVETLTGRTVLWATSISMSLQAPWFGHGIDSFRALIPAFGSFEAVHAHNEWLQQFFEFGVAGVVMTAGVYGSFYRLARRTGRERGSGELRTLALGLLLFTLVRGLTDTVSSGLSFPLWLLAALSIGLAAREGEVRA